MNAMTKVAEQLSTEELKQQAIKMANCFEDYADDILMALLNALMPRIPESDYVAFCESL